jgi:hypothetical protein
VAKSIGVYGAGADAFRQLRVGHSPWRAGQIDIPEESVKIRPWAINSVAEYYLHTVGVTGSNPVSPILPQPETLPFSKPRSNSKRGSGDEDLNISSRR